MAGGGQDRACALGWGEGFHPNRPKTVARKPHHTTESYVCFKTDRVGYRRCGIRFLPADHDYIGRHLAHHEKVVVMDQHENLQELLTRLNNIRDSMEEALDDIRGIEDDYRRGLLEAHITGAIREINAQITELVSSH
jgi:hypothetical protein